jgi:hypothetical protein
MAMEFPAERMSCARSANPGSPALISTSSLAAKAILPGMAEPSAISLALYLRIRSRIKSYQMAVLEEEIRSLFRFDNGPDYFRLFKQFVKLYTDDIAVFSIPAHMDNSSMDLQERVLKVEVQVHL